MRCAATEMASQRPRFPFLQVDCEAGQAEQLAAELVERGASGVEIRDDGTLARGPGGGWVRLVAAFGDRTEAAQVMRALAAEPKLHCLLGEVVGDEWREAYKRTFAPFRLTASLWVVPPWEDDPPGEPANRLLMDPGRAFGTGLHPTTALVAAQLEQRRAAFAGREVLDAGTGSGVLALAALRFGARRVRAIDTDAEAVAVARHNVELNQLAERAAVDTGPLETVTGRYAMVVANIRPDVLRDLAPALLGRLAPGGVVVLSGILDGEYPAVLEAYGEAARAARVGLRCLEVCRHGDRAPGAEDWVALVLQRGG